MCRQRFWRRMVDIVTQQQKILPSGLLSRLLPPPFFLGPEHMLRFQSTLKNNVVNVDVRKQATKPGLGVQAFQIAYFPGHDSCAQRKTQFNFQKACCVNSKHIFPFFSKYKSMVNMREKMYNFSTELSRVLLSLSHTHHLNYKVV